MPHYPAPVKTFGVFYAGIRKQEEGDGGAGGCDSGRAKRDHEDD